jgi:hypothetical protein
MGFLCFIMISRLANWWTLWEWRAGNGRCKPTRRIQGSLVKQNEHPKEENIDNYTKSEVKAKPLYRGAPAEPFRVGKFIASLFPMRNRKISMTPSSDSLNCLRLERSSYRLLLTDALARVWVARSLTSKSNNICDLKFQISGYERQLPIGQGKVRALNPQLREISFSSRSSAIETALLTLADTRPRRSFGRARSTTAHRAHSIS